MINTVDCITEDWGVFLRCQECYCVLGQQNKNLQTIYRISCAYTFFSVSSFR